MNFSIIRNDFKRNRGINIAVLSFIIFSAGLVILSTLMSMQTVKSISQLYRVAQPPHFLQMHKGEINQDEIDDFMSGYGSVKDWQTVQTISVYGDRFTVIHDEQDYNLSDLRLDIGLVRQPEARDLLLDSSHQKVILNKGEIGIPVLLKSMYEMKIGDKIILTEGDIALEFVIKEFILDSQMNSPLTSSTRMLLSDEDFDVLSGNVGENEYLIEAYFDDTDEALDFKTAYQNAGLPQHGQAVTYKMIFLLSAFTDIVTVFVMLFVSMLLIVVSFVCIKFTILSTLEEEVSEIGTMKAIGFSFNDIRSIYISKYRVLSIAGVLMGYVFAFIFSNIFTKHITTTFGKMSFSMPVFIMSVLAAVIVYLIIIAYCKNVLKKIRRLTVVDALVIRTGFGRDKNKGKDGLNKAKILSVNWLLGIREIIFHFKQWVAVFSVVIIAAMMVIIPLNLLNTFEDPKFVTYMGSSLEDILIEVEEGSRLELRYSKTKEVLESDESIVELHEYRRVLVQTLNSENELMNLDVDSGDNSGKDLQYISGKLPESDDEIALSYLNAILADKKPGDSILLHFANTSKEFIVSGIYQDVTSGGYTSKSRYSFPDTESNKYSFSANLDDNLDLDMKVKELSEQIGAGTTVDSMREFINQVLGGVTSQLKLMVLFIIVISICLVILISVLFLKLRLIKDMAEISSLKTVGFSSNDLRKQYMIKTGAVSIAGIVMGIILTDTLGNVIINAVLSISGLGIRKIELVSNSLIEYLVLPSILMLLTLTVTWAVTKIIKKYDIISLINE